MAERQGTGVTQIICRVCGAVNASGETFCQHCWSGLGTAIVLGESEVASYRAAERRRARWERWRKRALLGMLIASIVALLGFCSYSPPAGTFPEASTRLSSASALGEWAMDGHNLGQTRAVADAYSPLGWRLRWSVQIDAPFVTAPVVAGGVVYIATGDGWVLALDAASGVARWRMQVDSPVDSSPAVAGDTLYVALRNRTLLALDRGNGAVRWSVQGSGPLIAPPIVAKGVVYAVSAVDGRVMGFDAASGRELWHGQLEGSWSTSAVSWAEHTILVAAGDRVFFFDTRTGEEVFSYDVPVGNVVGAPVVAGGNALVASSNGFVYGLKLRDSAPFWDRVVRRSWTQLWVWGMAPRPPRPAGLLWTHPVRMQRGEGFVQLAATDSTIYLATTAGRIMALDGKTLETIWSYQGNGAMRGAPAVAGDTVYAGVGNQLLALRAGTGDVVGNFRTAAAIASNAVVTRGTVYVVDVDGTLYAIE